VFAAEYQLKRVTLAILNCALFYSLCCLMPHIRDLIEVYKIFSGKYDATVTNWLTDRYLESHYDLRGHRFSLYQSQIHYDTRKCNFTNTIISIWNGLPDTVISATTVDTFKARLDRFGQNQEIIYNWKTDIHFGSRS